MAANGPRSPLAWFRAWADLLDSRFRVPGTQIRFGIDPLLSLVPGIGELASPIFAVLLILQGARQRVPKVILVRMMLNALIDAAIGAVPLAGTVGDVFWRANARNLALLETYSSPGEQPTRQDYLFVGGILAAFALALTIVVALGLWMVIALVRTFGL
ncbi:MAG: DUF4112 domain-containing protein [Planctomycetes bacterium]|nr:DUF4112 domain-containing protein [Planctomycetota bacterium]